MKHSDVSHLVRQQELSSTTLVKPINQARKLSISTWVVLIVIVICSLSFIITGLLVRELFWLHIFGWVLFFLTLWIIDCYGKG